MSLTGIQFGAGITLGAGIHAGTTGGGGGSPSTSTAGFWSFDPSFVGQYIGLDPYGGRNNMVATATNPESSIAIGTLNGGISLYDYSSLVMFSFYSVQEESGDVSSALARVGIANQSADLNNPLGNDLNSWGWAQDGSVWFNGEQVQLTGAYPSWGPGDYMDIALNLDTHGAWLRVNGGDWQGRAGTDPALSQHRLSINGGFALNGSGSAGVFPAVTPGAHNYVDAIRIQTVTYSIPSGFSAI